jgi:hypothetical protein
MQQFLEFIEYVNPWLTIACLVATILFGIGDTLICWKGNTKPTKYRHYRPFKINY